MGVFKGKNWNIRHDIRELPTTNANLAILISRIEPSISDEEVLVRAYAARHKDYIIVWDRVCMVDPTSTLRTAKELLARRGYRVALDTHGVRAMLPFSCDDDTEDA